MAKRRTLILLIILFFASFVYAMENYHFTNFSAGVLTRKLDARIDFDNYFRGARTIENCIVFPQGGVAKRPGTAYVSGVSVHAETVRLVPFVYNEDNAYIIEFGNGYCRFFKDHRLIDDPDSYTKLLLHADGNDASTTFTDDGDTGHAITASGNAQIDNAYHKFGSGSLLCDGTSDYISAADHADWYFASGTLTVDFWVRFNDTSQSATLWGQSVDANNYISFDWNASWATPGFNFLVFSAGVGVLDIRHAVTGGLSDDTWYHVALIRGWGGSANEWVITVQGDGKNNETDSSAVPDLAAAFTIGDGYTFAALDGWIDEFRVSKGIARWTTDFNPPQTPYPYGTTGYSISTTYTEEELSQLRFAQHVDDLYITHSSHAPAKLTRTSDASWSLTDIDFDPPMTVEQMFYPQSAVTPAATTGTDILFTATSSVFLAGDIGRVLTYGASEASITGLASASSVTCDILTDFPDTNSIAANSWYLDGTPARLIDPDGSAKSVAEGVGKVGKIVKVNSWTDLFRSTDVGDYIYLNNGLIEITEYEAGTTVYGVVLDSLDSSVSSYAWTLEEEMWTSSNGYPSYVGFTEQRLVLASSTEYPLNIWASKTGDFVNFTKGSNDDEALDITVASSNASEIQWLNSGQILSLGTLSSEWTLGAMSTTDALTPSTIRLQKHTTHGSEKIDPVSVGRNVLFVQKNSKKIREFGYDFEKDGYLADDLTLLAEHLTNDVDIIDIDYQQEPFNIVWVLLSSGDLLGLTYIKEHNITAWHKHTTDGDIEDIAVIPGETEDELWMVVNRVINGETKRYIEYMKPLEMDTIEDSYFVDCGITYDGAATISISGLSHIVSKYVQILADGKYVGTELNTVLGGGVIGIDSAASTIHVGLSYDAILETMEPPVGLGQTKRIGTAIIQFYETAQAEFGSSSSDLDTIDFDSGTTPYTGYMTVDYPGGYDTDPTFYMKSDEPLPFSVSGIVLTLE